MKYTDANLKTVSRALYQITGNEYYLLPMCEAGVRNNMQEFHRRRSLLCFHIANGDTYKHPLYKLDGTPLPFENVEFGVINGLIPFDDEFKKGSIVGLNH